MQMPLYAHMKKSFLIVGAFSLLFVGCVNKDGLSVESSRPIKGNPNAIINVLEFSDLQCPACKMVHYGVVKPLLAQYGNKISFEFKHFPLNTIHPYAIAAAMASECAADQGKFWEFVDIAFENQKDLNVDSIFAWGDDLGLNTELYARCWKSNIKRDFVLSEFQEGRKLDVSGTPTFLVNGKQVPTNELPQAIDQAYASMTQRL